METARFRPLFIDNDWGLKNRAVGLNKEERYTRTENLKIISKNVPLIH